MPNNDLQSLAATLSESDKASARRAAAKKLGTLRDPNAIAPLVRAYQDDEDEAVRQAAADSLRIYRAMQPSEPDPDDPFADINPAQPSDVNALPNLMRMRQLLTVGLVITVALNLVTFLFGGGAQSAESITPTAVAPTPRQALIDLLRMRLSAVESEAPSLRQPYVDLKVEVEDLNSLPKCVTLPEKQLSAGTLQPVDAQTYPDLPPVQQAIDTAIGKFLALRAKYAELCAFQDVGQLQARLLTEGGASALVTQVDALLNQDLSAARLALETASARPEPTAQPTAAPPTEQVAVQPTDPQATANTPSNPVNPTAGTVVVNPSVPAATVPPLIPPTEPPVVPVVVTATLPPPPTAALTFTMASLQRYHYRLSAEYEAREPSGRPLRGALELTARVASQTPLIGRYEIGISDDPAIIAFANGWLSGPLYMPGNAFYTIVNDVLYHAGAGALNNALCDAQNLSLENSAPFLSLDPLRMMTQIAPAELLNELVVGGVNAEGKAIYAVTRTVQGSNGTARRITVNVVGDLAQPERITIQEESTLPETLTAPAYTFRSLTFSLLSVSIGPEEITANLEAPCRTLTPR